jgi:hypothetical protein
LPLLLYWWSSSILKVRRKLEMMLKQVEKVMPL